MTRTPLQTRSRSTPPFPRAARCRRLVTALTCSTALYLGLTPAWISASLELVAPLGDGGSRPGAAPNDGAIHVIPAMSAASLENGDRAVIQAVAQSIAPITSVTARILHEASGPNAAPVATLTLAPAPAESGGVNASATKGLWQTEWKAEGLEEAFYRVEITVVDSAGRAHTDSSLRFSDPIAGNDAQGTTSYPDGGMRRMDQVRTHAPENFVWSAVMDAENGYAYFGTSSNSHEPGNVVKVALGAEGEPPRRVGSLALESGERNLRSAVMDAASGYAYFGTNTSPGRVVKVALGEGDDLPTRVGAVTLEWGENELRTAVIDETNGYAFFGTYTSPGRVVKIALGAADSPPSRVGAVTLDGGENLLMTSVIDRMNGHAYFGTFTGPGRVVQVSLGQGDTPPARVGSVRAAASTLLSSTLDEATGHAYFTTSSSPGWMVMLRLGEDGALPTLVGAVALNTNENRPHAAAIDPTNGHLYVSVSRADNLPGTTLKYALGEDGTLPTRVDSSPMSDGDHLIRVSVTDVAGRHVYFATARSPSVIVKVAMGEPEDPPTRVGSASLMAHGANLQSAVLDPLRGYAYFGSGGSRASVSKIRLGDGGRPPEWVGALTLEYGEDGLGSAVIDPDAGFAYFGTSTRPGLVVKVALGEGDDPPTRVGAVTLEDGEDYLYSAVIGTGEGYAYFGTRTQPGRVVKIALGEGAAPPSRVGAVTLNAGENNLQAAVIDTEAGYALFATGTSPGRVVKVALGTGDSLPARVGAVTLQAGEDFVEAGVIDEARGLALFGTNTSPARVVKVALGEGSSSPTRVGAVTLNTGENQVKSAVIDPERGIAWFGFWFGASVVAVAPGADGEPPLRLHAVPASTHLVSGVIDTSNGVAYFGHNDSGIGRITPIAVTQRGFLKGSKLVMPEKGLVKSVSFYSHAASGSLRLAVYSADASPELLWHSGVVENTAAEDWIVVPIDQGSPASLDLEGGDYLLAWQIDTHADVPSHTQGAWNEGFSLVHGWGEFPATIDFEDMSPTRDRWSMYITYDAVPNAPSEPGATDIGSDAITWTWRDDSDDETGFKVYAGPGLDSPPEVTHLADAGATSWRQTGLSPNTVHAMSVAATNDIGDSERTDDLVTWTAALTPSAPIVDNVTTNTLDVRLQPTDGNPTHTEYAISLSGGTQWVQASGALGSLPHWRTAADWPTTTVTDLQGGTMYGFVVRARNGDGIETEDGPSAAAATHCTFTYTARDNGGIVGQSPQIVAFGAEGEAVEASADDGHHFDGWSDDVETAERRDACVAGDIAVTASFAVNVYEISVSASPEAGGAVHGGGNYQHGQSVSLTASAADTYGFAGWSEDGASVSDEARLELVATSSRSLVAHFERAGLSVSASPAAARAGEGVEISVQLATQAGEPVDGVVEVCVSAEHLGGGFAEIASVEPTAGLPLDEGRICGETTALGRAVFEVSTITSGEVEVTALSETLGAGGAVTVTFSAAEPRDLEIVAVDEVVAACAEAVVEIRLVDAYGNLVTGPEATATSLTLTVESDEGTTELIGPELEEKAWDGTRSVTGSMPAKGWASARVSLDAEGEVLLSASSDLLAGAPEQERTATLSFELGSVDAALSELSATGTSLLAGAGEIDLLVVPRDACGLALGAGQDVIIETTFGRLTEVVELEDGAYASVFGADVEECPEYPAIINATVNDVTLDTTLEIWSMCGEVDPASPAWVESGHEVVEACASDGVFARVALVPFDVSGEPMYAGLEVHVSGDAPRIIAGDVVEETDPVTGETMYVIEVGSNRCSDDEAVALEILVGGVPLESRPEIFFTCPPVPAGGVAFTAEPSEVPADGSSAATIRLDVLDACGNPAFARAISLSLIGQLAATLSAEIVTTVDSVGDGEDGSATVEVRSVEPGEAGLTAEIDGETHPSALDLITFASLEEGADGDEPGCGCSSGGSGGGTALVLALGLLLLLTRPRRSSMLARMSVAED